MAPEDAAPMTKPPGSGAQRVGRRTRRADRRVIEAARAWRKSWNHPRPAHKALDQIFGNLIDAVDALDSTTERK